MNRKPWTPEEIEILKEMYPHYFCREIMAVLGRTRSSVYEKVLSLHLKSSPEKLRRMGEITASHPNSIASRYHKGSVPKNKGVKVSPETYAKMQPTMFKKGHASHNHREVGSERVNVDGYIEIKVAEPNKWGLKHRVIWEQANGAIPPGYNIQFKNHNPLDCRLENLYIISQAVQMKTQNAMYAKYPEELQSVMRLKGAVKRAINKAQKNGK